VKSAAAACFLRRRLERRRPAGTLRRGLVVRDNRIRGVAWIGEAAAGKKGVGVA
jgi:hypothetical protein